MLFYLFEYLGQFYDIPGAGLFEFISFRAGSAIVVSLLISMVLGGKIIRMLQKMQVGESVRDLGLEGQKQKEGTPTMGGLIIIAAILIPTLLFARIANIYVMLMILSTIWMGTVGFLDDYIKVFKKDKKGLAGKFKVVGQVGLGLLVGISLYFHPYVSTKTSIPESQASKYPAEMISQHTDHDGEEHFMVTEKNVVTTIPFVKGHEFDYAELLPFEDAAKYSWLIFIPIVILIITAVSNSANLTDGIDGLATGTSAIAGIVLGIFAYISGNIIFSDYLNIMYIPNAGELTVFIAAFVGACIGFLWYNAYPAQVFMGDTGSLAIGGIIGALAIMVRKELLIPILCGIFFMESLSVIMQVSYFKYTKRKFGEGKRIFLMSPLHHHFQKLGMHEAKIVSRFWIVGILLALFTIATLKIR